MADSPKDHDELISRFCNLTGVGANEARLNLSAHEWDVGNAVAEFYMSQDDEIQAETREANDDISPNIGGGRTLGGRPAPQPIPSTSSLVQPSDISSRPPTKKRFATLGDLGGNSGHAGHSHADRSEDDSDDQDLFAGGEKSALAVQNPDELKRKILEKARRNQHPQRDEPSIPTSRFTGTARTLGGDDVPSRVIEDSTSNTPKKPTKVERRLHFWANGFSVDDGPLYRSDDPANAEVLAMIKSGRAPLEIMNVQPHQEVDVKVEQHDEKYIPPKKVYKSFAGGGQRLGNPTPAVLNEVTATSTTSDTTSQPVTDRPGTVEVNESEPIITIQIRLGDGTRLSSRFNSSHTIGDLYSYVTASSAASQGRSWVLMTTFPSKELSDKEKAFGDLAEFKKGGVVVQKWQ